VLNLNPRHNGITCDFLGLNTAHGTGVHTDSGTDQNVAQTFEFFLRHVNVSYIICIIRNIERSIAVTFV